MYTASCSLRGCDWEPGCLFGDPVAALNAIDRHLWRSHGRKPGDPALIVDGLVAVPTDEAEEAAYILEAVPAGELVAALNRALVA